jgi:DNA polymerase
MSSSVAQREELLAELSNEIRACKRCVLCRERQQAVPGEGSVSAPVMFVGEAPGEQEDRQGRPFVGPAGQFLNQLLLLAGLKRPDVYIANTVKCRPPNNRTPMKEEIDACNDYLMAQIALIQPKVICTLGSPALKTLIDPDLQISKVHGTVFQKDGLTYIPLYHPAAALHREALKDVLRQDFIKLKEILEKELA